MAGAKLQDDVAAGKAAAALHDRFNIVAMTPVTLLTVHTLIWPSLEVDTMLTYFTFSYILVDIVYHLMAPHCQPNAFRLRTILFHHSVTACLLLWPIQNPEWRCESKKLTVVEINTIILTVNKGLKWRSLQIAFLTTWVSMRLMWKPYLVYIYHQEAVAVGRASLLDLGYWQVVVTMASLCVLNFLWTAEVLGVFRCGTSGSSATAVAPLLSGAGSPACDDITGTCASEVNVQATQSMVSKIPPGSPACADLFKSGTNNVTAARDRQIKSNTLFDCFDMCTISPSLLTVAPALCKLKCL